mmetsp:Transcript_1972/g.2534  ORF Transcript_1972/g.2534 Transcript_1972/m.2534 type:complete len:237 (-) Transcript_1972:1730-2440(-)|eukprot:CAMPEP_0204846700 /NCGR_PEP_ID=MMETSP1347-20130617/2198_1 /ASSEMBLY_ACC=CAM_ASM_000690 /TAXON_ID=215587 /ORGANISM="Aplanochytrium stocchinoi, Strain GSBS06" /LENGTH=236 /DNA_ID=CAMNT_0051987389 /DNA_START=205 /DNA_END=915 /DNA_ORIENTATION=-
MIFRQLFDPESCTYTYVLGDEATKEAIIIDPVIELVERDQKVLDDLELNLKYALNTHVHADHITGSGKLKLANKGCQSVLGKKGNEEAKADMYVDEGELIKVGNTIELEPRHTPGHTQGCYSFVCSVAGDDTKLVFTGDTILIRGCGRTDFQGGSSESLYNSVKTKLFTLPDNTKLFSAHDYKGHTMSTIGEEKVHNPRLTKSLDEFKDIMENLNLAYPKKIDVSLPANKLCGLQD